MAMAKARTRGAPDLGAIEWAERAMPPETVIRVKRWPAASCSRIPRAQGCLIVVVAFQVGIFEHLMPSDSEAPEVYLDCFMYSFSNN